MDPVVVGDRQVALAAVDAVVADADAPLGALEIGQHVDIAPAAIAALRPIVEIRALAAVVDHAVDRTRPAQRAALRGGDARGRRCPRPARSGTARCKSGLNSILMKPAGMWMYGCRSGGPHSSTQTVTPGPRSGGWPAPNPRRRCRRSRSRTCRRRSSSARAVIPPAGRLHCPRRIDPKLRASVPNPSRSGRNSMEYVCDAPTTGPGSAS